MVRCDPSCRVQTSGQRVAVIGLGVAGATACHLLSQKHTVVGIESAPEAGLHVHSVHTQEYNFDMPLRAVSPHYYPNLYQLYQHLGVAMHNVNYENTGVDAETGEAYFRYKNLMVGPFALSIPWITIPKSSTAAAASVSSAQQAAPPPPPPSCGPSPPTKNSRSAAAKGVSPMHLASVVSSLIPEVVRERWIPWLSAVVLMIVIVSDYLWLVFATPWDLWWSRPRSTAAPSVNAADGGGADGVVGKGKAFNENTHLPAHLGSSSSAPQLLGGCYAMTIHEYLAHRRFSKAFEERFLLPVMSSLLSCSYDQVAQYPAEFICGFFCSRLTTFFTGWQRVGTGVREVSAKLLTGVECRYRCRVTSLRRSEDNQCVLLSYVQTRRKRVGSAEAEEEEEEVVTVVDERFDHVVVATESNIVPLILKDASEDERLATTSVSSFTANIVAHTDASLMPVSRHDWSGLNYYSRVDDVAASAAPHAGDDVASSTLRHRRVVPAADVGNDVSTSLVHQRSAVNDVSAINKSSAGSQTTSPPRPNASMTTAHLNRFSPRNSLSRGSGACRSAGDVKATEGKRCSLQEGAADAVTTPSSPKDVFESWNPYTLPAEGTVIKQVVMSRAVWTVEGRDQFIAAAPRCQGRRRVWLAGSYAAPGVTLLEQAVTSALDVALDFDVDVPFKVRPTVELYGVAIGFAACLQVLAWCYRTTLGRLFG